MIGFDIDDYRDDAPAIAKGNYNLWRLMIDKAYQKRGYGKEAVRLALDFIESFPCGKADYCWLSYEPENDDRRIFVADVIIHALCLGIGYGSSGLDLLCEDAKKNGVTLLYDDIAIDNPAITIFLKHGFVEEYRTDEIIMLKKEL